MFPWVASRSIPWEDTFHFHARLFRCFLLSFLDAGSELALFSQGTERIRTVLGQLADVGLAHDADLDLHARHPTHQISLRCPPKRHGAASLPSLVTNPLADQTLSLPPFASPILYHHDNKFKVPRGLHDVRPAVAVDNPGPLNGDGGLVSGAGMLYYLLLWLFVLAIVVLRSRGSSDARAVCRLSRMAVNASTNPNGCVVRSLHGDEATQNLVADIHAEIGHQANMPGAWFYERREQNAHHIHEAPVSHTLPWTLFHLTAHTVRVTVWAHCLRLASIFWISDHGRQPTLNVSVALDEFGLGAGVSTVTTLDETEGLGTAPDHLTSEPGSLIRNPHESTYTRRCGPLAIDDVAVKEPADPVQTLDIACEPQIGLTFPLAASNNADCESYQDSTPSNGDESANDSGSDGSFLSIAERRTDERKDDRVVDQHQDDALSNTGCPLLLRRAVSTGHLWRKRDVFEGDDDEATEEDFYWTDQVRARLSCERDTRLGPCRSDWSNGSSWPREGREDKTDNWRLRDLEVRTATPEPCQVDDNRTKLRRYSSPPLNANVVPSHLARSEVEPRGIYVVPQKRGARCWSPVSTSRASDNPSGHGFFPLRKTPSLLTPESWRPGCLYVPDPPVDESRQAKAWLDRLSCGGAFVTAHASGNGTGLEMMDDVPTTPYVVQEGPVSWRDRYENDPASRRIMAGHRRSLTEG